MINIDHWISKVSDAERQAHHVLSGHETSRSRVIHLEQLKTRLSSGTPIDVQDYFNEAVLCLEQGFYRASIVMSWAGHFHVYVESLFIKHESEVKSIRSKWKFSNTHELKENYPEAQILRVAKDVQFTDRIQSRILDGQLSTRNRCAHPTLYKPPLNSAIGYVDTMIQQTLGYLSVS